RAAPGVGGRHAVLYHPTYGRGRRWGHSQPAVLPGLSPEFERDDPRRRAGRQPRLERVSCGAFDPDELQLYGRQPDHRRAGSRSSRGHQRYWADGGFYDLWGHSALYKRLRSARWVPYDDGLQPCHRDVRAQDDLRTAVRWLCPTHAALEPGMLA